MALNQIQWKRLLRTPTSERFLGQIEGEDVAAVDLHYCDNKTVAGTVTILEGANLNESNLPELLSQFDDSFLPEVDLSSGNVFFTIVIGRTVGDFTAGPNDMQAE